MASETWLVVEVEDSIGRVKPLKGEKLRFLVSPRLQIVDETREVDEIVNSAVKKGMETRFCSSSGFVPIPRRSWAWAQEKILKKLREERHLNIRTYDVSIDAVAALVKYDMGGVHGAAQT